MVLALGAPPSFADSQGDARHGPHATRARAESRAFASRSELSSAELIKAAKKAGRRLRIHERLRPSADIPVHRPIVGHRPVLRTISPASRFAVNKSTLGVGVAFQAASALTTVASGVGCGLECSTTPLSGAMTSPLNEGQTSTVFSLGAALSGGCTQTYLGGPWSCTSTGYTGVTFQYRAGTTGSFANIPASAVSEGGDPVAWPVTTEETGSNEFQEAVSPPELTWLAKQTITTSGLLQIQAVFSNSSGDTYTTSPVTVTLNTSGTGGDFAAAVVGPVTVGLQSGNLSLSATDVSIASYGTSLQVSRTFNTLAPGTSSGFGPGWTSSVPVQGTTDTWSSIINDGSYAVLTDASGSAYTFAAGTASGGITPYTAQGQAAAEGLTLTLSSSGFTLADPSGDQVDFTATDTNTPDYYTPLQVSQPGDSQTVGYIYDATKTDAGYGKLELMVAPDAALAAGTSNTTACPYPASASTWSAGCRGLQFSYNASGDVSQITFESYGGSTLTSTAVADYSYDSQGRLVGEWDPRISPNLITTYSYDETSTDPTYGFLTAVSPAQVSGGTYLQPWTFSYNTTASSPDYLKLTAVSRSDSRGTGTQTIDYEVPLTTAAGGPINMDPTTVGSWNQTDVPASAVAIFPATHVPSSPPTSADWPYAQITYYDANGMAVNTADYASGAWDVTTTQYDTYGDVLSTLSAADRAEALAAGSSSASVAAELETVNQYTQLADGSQELTATYGPLHNTDVAGLSGLQQVRDLTTYTYDQGAPNNDVAADGLPYQLVTTQTQSASIGAGIPGTADDDPRTTSYAYSNGTDNTGWTIYSPLKITTDPTGLAITNTTQYNENASLYGGDPVVTATCMPSDTGCSGAGTQQTIYYTAGTNPLLSSCGNQPAWANLVCQTQPAAQPGTTGLPNLPVTTYTYNVYLQPLTETQTIGSSTRTYAFAYDSGGRQTDESIVSTGSGLGTALPTTQTVYSPDTGLVSDQETVNSSGTVTATIAYGYDDFGDLTSYTDASDNTSTYTYNLAGQATSRDDGKGTDTVTYNSAGLPVSETDSQAGIFSATYNPDGNLASEAYPGGVTAVYGYDETGMATTLSYAGTDWTAPLTDIVTPDAFGDWASQSITDTATALSSSQNYAYDNDDRLSSVQDTESGQCTTRSYAYNADSDRTALATASPGSGGACTTTNPTTETYTYDSADRLINSGYTYDSQGDITTTPSVDAGDNGDLTATYYANDMLASQAQGGETLTWSLDPTEQRFSTYTADGVTQTEHYAGPTSSSASWYAGSNGSWSRTVPGTNGMLAATVTASNVTLDLANLHGDVLATASTSPTSTGPSETYIYTEFGTSEQGTPGVSGWLGDLDPSTQALGSDILMGARVYNPFDGRFDQIDPLQGGSANAYDYAFQNPITNADTSGMNATIAERDDDQNWTYQYSYYSDFSMWHTPPCTSCTPDFWFNSYVDYINCCTLWGVDQVFWQTYLDNMIYYWTPIDKSLAPWGWDYWKDVKIWYWQEHYEIELVFPSIHEWGYWQDMKAYGGTVYFD
jgi:RHS repeat-associated protein